MELIRAAVDTKTKKVACVLLQAVYGGDRRVCHLFDTKNWELAPTPNMAMVSGTLEQWQTLADKMNRKKI